MDRINLDFRTLLEKEFNGIFWDMNKALVEFTDDEKNLCKKWWMTDYPKLKDDMLVSSWDYEDMLKLINVRKFLKKSEQRPRLQSEYNICINAYSITLYDVGTLFEALRLVVA